MHRIGGKRVDDGDMGAGGPTRCPRIAGVATMRNEGPFILEWVAWHRLIGFTELWVCSNDCVDASPDLLDRLAERGLIRHLRCTPDADARAQLVAYAAVEAAMAPDWPDWIMVLDADEFLNVHVGAGMVTDLIAAVPDATAWCINWRIFGSSGHADVSPEPVTTRFTRAAVRDHGVNRSFKTLFRLADAYHCPLLPHGPGHARDERLDAIRPVDGGGHPLPARYARSDGFLQTDPGGVDWTLAQVNHYNTRSRADYLAKHHRGGGQGPERWDRESNWAAFDRKEVVDLSIQRHAAALGEALAALHADPAIAAAHARCVTRYAAHVAALADVPA